MKISLYVYVLLSVQVFAIEAKQAVIVLYGCSSVGKTSISQELMKSLPGSWKYIASNQFRTTGPAKGNKQLWDKINELLDQGHSVIVDTHSSSFFLDKQKDIALMSVLLYCSPEKLIEHITKRNTNKNPKTHRDVKRVMAEFCAKFKVVESKDKHIDVISKSEIKTFNPAKFFALQQLRNYLFSSKNQYAYVASCYKKYDCFVNTGKFSINQCAQRIQKKLTELYGEL